MAGANGERVQAGREDFFRAFLVGYGALFFAPSTAAGALFLLATFARSAVLGTAVLVGLFSSTATAHALRRSRLELESGLYGFNGALAAFACFSLTLSEELAFALCPIAAAATTWVQARLVDGAWSRRLAIPAMSLASLVVCVPLLAALASFGFGAPYPSTVLAPFLNGASDLFRADFYGAEIRAAMAPSARDWPTTLLVLAGFAVHSRRLLIDFLAGALLGAGVGFLFLGWYGALCGSFVLITAAPTFVALAGTFVAPSWSSRALAALAVVLSFFAWFFLGLALRDLGLPFLTLPAWITITSVLTVLRFAPAGSRWLPALVPLHQIGAPEANAAWAKAREFGWRYWQSIAHRELANGSIDPRELERARSLVAHARRIVAITGAGLSTESGIPDYRTGAVAWKQYDVEHFRWARFLESEESRAKYWEMSQDFYLVLRGAEPNPAHRFFAELARRGKLERVVTQNVDRLHQRAGLDDESVVEIHGNEHRVSCLACRASFDRGEVFRWIQGGVRVPYCPQCQGMLKPDSIAFDQPMEESSSSEALDAVRNCDLLIVAGTSLEVQPIASLPLVALRAKKPLVIVNLQPTDYDAFASVVLRGRVGEVLPALLA